MPLVGVHTRRVRDVLKQPGSFGPDLFVFLLVGAVIGGLVMLGQRMATPYQEKTDIDLSLWALPQYTFLSLGRGLAAYVLSLIFTLVYGSIAAHNRRAERFMIPLLDVLQSIPVLAFLPALVLAMIALFPNYGIGLELACIVMIFTGQAWNMTFSYYASVRNIPQSLRDVATIEKLDNWQVFRLLELPAAMIGLVWNSMMSMAGGWFFLMVNEAFTLRNRDFRLPGLGSYMNEAVQQDDFSAMIGAVVAMIIMIILVDQFLWRPLVVWSQRFKMEDTAEEEQPRSWVLDVIRRSRIYLGLSQRLSQSRGGVSVARRSATAPGGRFWSGVKSCWQFIQPIVRWVVVGLLVVGMGWGLWSLVSLMSDLPLHDPDGNEDWLTIFQGLFASFLRTTAAVALGAAWALPVGILIGLSAKWSRRLQPVIQVVASFPAPMLYPVVTLLLAAMGIPFSVGCVVLLLLGSQWYILFNVLAGAKAIPDDLKQVAQVYGMSRWRVWTRLYIPCVFPYFVTGLITAAGGAWNALIVSEYVQVQGTTFDAFGLGSTICKATATGHFSLLAASVVTMATCVVLINRLFWKRLYRLAENRYSLNA
jgi:NitT/TauT family transport system permease protein